MLREAIATGETVEQAFENACVQLGVETVDAEFEVLELPEKRSWVCLAANRPRFGRL